MLLSIKGSGDFATNKISQLKISEDDKKTINEFFQANKDYSFIQWVLVNWEGARTEFNGHLKNLVDMVGENDEFRRIIYTMSTQDGVIIHPMITYLKMSKSIKKIFEETSKPGWEWISLAFPKGIKRLTEPMIFVLQGLNLENFYIFESIWKNDPYVRNLHYFICYLLGENRSVRTRTFIPYIISWSVFWDSLKLKFSKRYWDKCDECKTNTELIFLFFLLGGVLGYKDYLKTLNRPPNMGLKDDYALPNSNIIAFLGFFSSISFYNTDSHIAATFLTIFKLVFWGPYLWGFIYQYILGGETTDYDDENEGNSQIVSETPRIFNPAVIVDGSRFDLKQEGNQYLFALKFNQCKF